MSNNQQQVQEYEEQDQNQQGGQQLQQPNQQQMQQANNYIPPRAEGYRPAVIRESRIKDRPYRKMNDSLKIKIELDLEVEVSLAGCVLCLGMKLMVCYLQVDLYARVKGDGTWNCAIFPCSCFGIRILWEF